MLTSGLQLQSAFPFSGKKIGEAMAHIHNILWSAKKHIRFFTKF